MLMLSTSSSFARDEISTIATETDNLWRTGAGAHDGAFTALSASMIGWGVGLAVGIALLAAALNHGTGTNTSNAHSCH
jgi:hypothetical protein